MQRYSNSRANPIVTRLHASDAVVVASLSTRMGNIPIAPLVVRVQRAEAGTATALSLAARHWAPVGLTAVSRCADVVTEGLASRVCLPAAALAVLPDGVEAGRACDLHGAALRNCGNCSKVWGALSVCTPRTHSAPVGARGLAFGIHQPGTPLAVGVVVPEAGVAVFVTFAPFPPCRSSRDDVYALNVGTVRIAWDAGVLAMVLS
mmetsp:Transcript_42810/g.83914  ORF Transcript_42810/g.83914 Transcript_42810/m.83914 type:complete len:205 (-) Transcript_42810:208-822(-)